MGEELSELLSLELGKSASQVKGLDGIDGILMLDVFHIPEKDNKTDIIEHLLQMLCMVKQLKTSFNIAAVIFGENEQAFH